MTAADHTRRLCRPVRDEPFMLLSVPTAVTGACAQCGTPVWVDAAQQLPPGLPPVVEAWCLDCAVADPDTGPTLARNLAIAEEGQRLGLPPHTWLAGRDDDE